MPINTFGLYDVRPPRGDSNLATTIIGMDDLLRRLRALGVATTGPNAWRIVEAGAIVLRDGMRKNIQKNFTIRTGLLYNRTIVFKVNDNTAEVGPRGVVYAATQEFGAVIRPRRAKFLRFIGKDGEVVYAKKVVIPPRPYIRPAVDSERIRVRRAMRDEARRMIFAAAQS